MVAQKPQGNILVPACSYSYYLLLFPNTAKFRCLHDMFAAWCWLPHAFSCSREIFRDVVWLNLDTQVHTKKVQAAHSVKWHSFPWGRVPECALLSPPFTEEGNFSLRNHSCVTEFGHLCGTVSAFFLPQTVGNCSSTASHMVSTRVVHCQWKPRCCWILVSDSSSSLPSESREN